MIEEQYVSFETAKMAKEKGFNEKTDSYYTTIGDKIFLTHIWNDNFIPFPENNDEFTRLSVHARADNMSYISAPTKSLLAAWLREIKMIKVFIDFDCFNSGTYRWIISTDGLSWKEFKSGYKTFEEAMEEGLRKALKLI